MLAVTSYLQQTLSPDVNIRRPAEKSLELLEGNEKYGIVLLHIVDQPATTPESSVIKMSAAVLFKNFIKKHWKEDGESNKICESDRNLIKSNIVSLLLKSDPQIQRLLSDALSVIGHEDFPDKWPNLLSMYYHCLFNIICTNKFYLFL